MQAIYGWRSASVANIDAFAAHFGVDAVAAVRVLSVNRRSGEPILAAANHIAAGLRSQHPQIAELRPPAPRSGQVRAALLPTVIEEQQWIADEVAALVASGTPAEHIAILGRANDQLTPMQRMLVARGVPASISGTAALTSSPYAMAVLATLRVLADPADNTSVAALLMGPRWRIGPADLEVLGSRAAHLAGGRPRPADSAVGAARLREQLGAASEVQDPVDQPSLLEAAADPGPGLSPQAAERLTMFLAELRQLQGQVGAPLPDLVADVVTLTGARVEADLAAGRHGLGDVGLAGLLRLVEDFSDADGRTGLGALLSYLDTAEQLGTEEDVDLPTMPGAVQLMTMHKAKGLEFPVVVLPHLCRESFPGGKGSERWTGYSHIVPSELRDDRHVLPALGGYTTKNLTTFVADCRSHDRTGDDRLAYVAVTRAEQLIVASGHWWGATQKKPKGPSEYLTALRELSTTSAEDPWADAPSAESGDPVNPLLEQVADVAWPAPAPHHREVGAAARAVAALSADDERQEDPWSGAARTRSEPVADEPAAQAPPTDTPATDEPAAQAPPTDTPATDEPAAHETPKDEPPTREPAAADREPGAAGAPSDPVVQQIAQWDSAILALLARTEQSAEDRSVATLPGVLSASATMDLAADPQAFARALLRPMPRRRNQHAELGTAFHAWVQARLGIQPLITDEQLPGAADEGIGSPEELATLQESFERLDYARRTPAGLEVPFSLSIGGRLIRGRIDAVFRAAPEAPDAQQWEVVDWKTSARDDADPLQLAIYRLAWAQLADVPVEAVGAAFVFVRSGNVQRPDHLLGEQQIARILSGQ